MTKNKQQTTSPTEKTRIETLLTQVNFFRATANQDLEYSDPRTRPAKEAAKRDAEEVLGGILAEYEHELRKGLAAVFVNGPADAVDEFAAIAAEEGPAAVVDVSAIYVQMATDVEASMRCDRMFEPSQFSAMLRSMTKITDSLDLRMVPTPNYTGDVMLATFDEVVAHVRKLVRDKMGDSLNELALVRQVTGQALKMNYSRQVLPVVLKNATPEEIRDMNPLFRGRTVSVAASGSNAKEGVFDAFNELAKLIKAT